MICRRHKKIYCNELTKKHEFKYSLSKNEAIRIDKALILTNIPTFILIT